MSMRFLSVHCFVRVCGLGLRVCKGLGLGFRALGFNIPKGRVYRFRCQGSIRILNYEDTAEFAAGNLKNSGERSRNSRVHRAQFRSPTSEKLSVEV